MRLQQIPVIMPKVLLLDPVRCLDFLWEVHLGQELKPKVGQCLCGGGRQSRRGVGGVAAAATALDRVKERSRKQREVTEGQDAG